MSIHLSVHTSTQISIHVSAQGWKLVMYYLNAGATVFFCVVALWPMVMLFREYLSRSTHIATDMCR